MPISYIPFAEKRKTTLDSRFYALCKYFKLSDIAKQNLSLKQRAYTVALLEFLRFYKKKHHLVYKKLKSNLTDALNLIISNPNLFYTLFDCNKNRLYTSTYSTGTSLLSNAELLYLIGYSLTHLAYLYTHPQKLTQLCMLESLVTIFHQLKLRYFFTKRFKVLMPPYYRKAILEVYRSKQILKQVQTLVKSNKKGKKYMRIFQKRLRIYTRKKKPFKN